ncbi:hypothetical protein AAC387_Pa10g1607 [Persea americana]
MSIFSANIPTPNFLLNNGKNPTSHHQWLHFSGEFLSFSSCLSPPHPTSKLSFSQKSSKPTPIKSKKTSISCSNGQPASTQTRKKKTGQTPVFSEGRDEDLNHLMCPGCGVFMQDKDPNLPGFYQKRVLEMENEEIFSGSVEELDELEELEEEEGEEEPKLKSTHDEIESFTDFDIEDDEDDGFLEDISGEFEGYGGGVGDDEKEEHGLEEIDGIDWDSDEDFEDEEEKLKKELDGFTPAGVGYGNITEEIMEKMKMKRMKISKSEKKKKAREAQKDEEAVTVCARCHSLRNYGQVKNEKVENLIPDFDFDRLISSRLMKPTGSSNVVVMVVDCVDFDGSFPKRAAKSLFKALDSGKKEAKFSRLPKLVLVATKVDLLPQQISPTRLDRWVRNRAKAGGAPRLSGVYLVSAHKDLGVRNLISFIKELAGPRGNVWVIGAQNAGKSTLINAFAKREGKKLTRLTEAAVPGTTLGILRIGGILPAKAKMYDTPGLLHPYLMTLRLNREEQKMVEIRKELKPRTYRIKAGQTLHLGCLARLDLIKASIETIYVTIWASPNISLHLGKVENSDEIWQKHAGIRLQPPAGEDRVSELGQWKQREFKVSGNSWDINSVDIAIAGLGWFSLGLKGHHSLRDLASYFQRLYLRLLGTKVSLKRR